jgi:hypothetical protein
MFPPTRDRRASRSGRPTKPASDGTRRRRAGRGRGATRRSPRNWGATSPAFPRRDRAGRGIPERARGRPAPAGSCRRRCWRVCAWSPRAKDTPRNRIYPLDRLPIDERPAMGPLDDRILFGPRMH